MSPELAALITAGLTLVLARRADHARAAYVRTVATSSRSRRR
jgi:hypothetical protein